VETIANSQSPTTAFPIPFDLAGLETARETFRFGALTPGKIPIEEWNDDFFRLTVGAQLYLDATFKHPTHTYAVGLSNGGAQVRSLLERYPGIVDGGVDWSGVYWSPSASILDYLPKFLAAMQAYVASGFSDANAAAAIVAAGYPSDLRGAAGHPSLWFEYYANQPSFYADLTTFAYALLVDPQATSSVEPNGCTPNAMNPTQLPGTCDATGLADPKVRASYVPSSAARGAIASFAHTGRIRKPLISIAGPADMFITYPNNATPYLKAVNAAGGGSRYWQYLVQGGTHVDPFANSTWGYGLQPQLPFAWAAFNRLVTIVEQGAKPPGAGTQQTVSSPSQI
jgi:pimeloyl-ACP methyl ester carboxylesterase